MKKILLTLLLALPCTATAEYLDVISFEMTGECTLPEYLEIVSDFNAWGAEHGYQSKIAVPLQSKDLNTYQWMGSAADAATFGKAWDAWRDAQADPDSAPAQLWARFQECTVNTGRYGFDVYP